MIKTMIFQKSKEKRIKCFLENPFFKSLFSIKTNFSKINFKFSKWCFVYEIKLIELIDFKIKPSTPKIPPFVFLIFLLHEKNPRENKIKF